MKDFLGKVRKAVESMGNGPYDDEKTIEHASEITRKTVEHCDKVKELPGKRNKKFE